MNSTQAVVPSYFFAGGSVPGNYHIFGADILKGQNNGDGWYIQPTSDGQAVAAVVCDGCGSSAHPEVATLRYPRIIAQTVLKQYFNHKLAGAGRDFCSQDDTRRLPFWESIRQTLLRRLKSEALELAGEDTPAGDVVKDYLFFTILGLLFTPEGACVFGIGDGVFVVNNEVITLDSGENNAPPYIAYGLYESDTPEKFRFVTHRFYGPGELDYALVATDGAEPFVKSPDTIIPITKNYTTPQSIGSLTQFREQPDFLRRKNLMQGFLAKVNTPAAAIDLSGGTPTARIHYGPLEDDTTLCHVAVNRQA